MNTLNVGSNMMTRAAVSRHSMVVRILLICGALSSLFHVAMDVIEGLQWQDYSWMSQEFSRLSAIGTPSRPLHLVLSPFYAVLVVAFGLGILWSAGRKRALRIVGGLLIAYGLNSYVWPKFFPLDRSVPMSAFTNTMHIILAAVVVLALLLQIGFGAAAFGKRFRLYSVVTLLAVLVFGALTGPQAAAMAAGQPTPWLGLIERVNIYSYMLWVVVLAVILLRNKANNMKMDGLLPKSGSGHTGNRTVLREIKGTTYSMWGVLPK